MILVVTFALMEATIPLKKANAQANVNVILLVQNESALDVDENNLKDFLDRNSFIYQISDINMIKTGVVSLSAYKKLYIRTCSEPVGYNGPVLADRNVKQYGSSSESKRSLK